ncbi:uncharacterized protein BCR38DRAFT_402491 [Pseudomassariella vexata]|uniref:Modin n=1 Tax=Pseudomassariella vexata TaxID=1141098 RepID=A0A1Y2DB37_9PEZI|nr:uncharacterized protein BCR38DRAFT_402491 [Pseudomassariella vexata]ORY56336.1 hypothetical protein BCR38DRAFT_402491 [Pseudomassariella vexata]
MGDGNEVENELALAALVVAVVAFIVATIQLAQSIIAGARGLPNCDTRVMGKWAELTSWKFRWRQLRLEINFEAPVIFLSSNDNKLGPVKDNDVIWYIDGSLQSCDDTRVELTDDINTRLSRERVHTVENELASWVKLLGAIQKMERYSRDWESTIWKEARMPRPDSHDGVLTLAVGVQSKKRSFDANPTVKKPYATTTLCHIIELAAILGMYWKEINRDQNKYRAEGNGYSLLGSRLDDFGIVFVFEQSGWDKFREERIIPTREVKEMCFGNIPTIYREKNRPEDEVWNQPFNEQKSLQTLQLGSRKEISDALQLIGCNTSTQLFYLQEKHKETHLFSVTFEILGMLGRTLHIPSRCFTYLPNPSIFPWNRNSFSLRRMLNEFHEHILGDVNIFAREGRKLPDEIESINALASGLNQDLPRHQDTNFLPQHLDKIHEALEETDKLLSAKKIDNQVVLDVMRRHLQEVLLAINTTAAQVTGAQNPPSPTTRTRGVTFDDLLNVPPENREREFMKKYFVEIRSRVISTSDDEKDDPAVGASLDIHKNSEQQQQQTHYQGRDQRNGQLSPGSKEEGGANPQQALKLVLATPSHASPVASSLANKGSGTGTLLKNEFEIRRNNVWCTLVFRMICWLLLHNFNTKDVQLSKSELIGSRLPVYIM